MKYLPECCFGHFALYKFLLGGIICKSKLWEMSQQKLWREIYRKAQGQEPQLHKE